MLVCSSATTPRKASGHHARRAEKGYHTRSEELIDNGLMLAIQPAPLPSAEDVHELLRVYDPELGMNIVDLGLVYRIQIDEEFGRVLVDMTLTTPACPVGPVIAPPHTRQLRVAFRRSQKSRQFRVDPSLGPGHDGLG